MDFSQGLPSQSRTLVVIPTLLKERPETKILVLSMQDDPRYVREAFAVGASGYVLKEAADVEVVAAVREVARGARYVHPELGARLIEALAEGKDPLDQLTPREREVLELIGRGFPNKLIARELGVSEKTVKTHVGHVLGVVYALSTAPIDEILVVPVYQHPFAKHLAPFADRLAMCRLAVGWLPGVTISTVEEELGGESRTLRTLELTVKRKLDGVPYVAGGNVLVVVPIDIPGSRHLLPRDEGMPRLQVIRHDRVIIPILLFQKIRILGVVKQRFLDSKQGRKHIAVFFVQLGQDAKRLQRDFGRVETRVHRPARNQQQRKQRQRAGCGTRAPFIHG